MIYHPKIHQNQLVGSPWGPWCRWSWPTGIPNPCPCPLWSYACCRSHVWTVPGAASEFRSSDWFESNIIETWKKARGIEPRSNATKYIFCFQRFAFLFFWGFHNMFIGWWLWSQLIFTEQGKLWIFIICPRNSGIKSQFWQTSGILDWSKI